MITWQDNDEDTFSLYKDGIYEGLLTLKLHSFRYYSVSNFSGLQIIDVEIPKHLSLDELKAWAVAVYRMGG